MFFKSAPKKVLIVDDDPSLLRQLRFRLGKRDQLSVVEAESGESGLEQAANNDFDLIILDWMLPDQAFRTGQTRKQGQGNVGLIRKFRTVSKGYIFRYIISRFRPLLLT